MTSREAVRKYLEGIRDERMTGANTATRVGSALVMLLELIHDGNFSEMTVGKFLNSPVFAKGLQTLGAVLFGNYKEGERGGYVDAEGNAELQSLTVREGLSLDRFLNTPTFLRGLISLGSIIMGEYAEGLRGGIITQEAFAELKELWVREAARAGSLKVDGDSAFNGDLSSPDFVSAFLGGLGWGIQKKEVENAAGETETRYTLEIDNISVRGTMRVFEMVISQLLGENGNRFFSDMMEVDHYDPETGRVWFDTHNGKLYNPFRVGDIVIVQQYNGNPSAENGWYVTKGYELRVTGTGIGEQEGADRQDWVTFDRFTSANAELTPATAITRGDTFVRADNDRDERRKGLIAMMTVGDNTPYMDILHAMKTDPQHALKGRFGRLEGIITDVFGSLEGFGAYLNNLYAVGRFFNAQTGESMNARIEAVRARFRTLYAETTYNIPDSDNFVQNGFFQRELEGWEVCKADGSSPEEEEGVRMLGAGASPLLFNGSLLLASSKTTAKVEEVEGIRMLHLRAMAVSQSFTDIRPNGTHLEMNSLPADDDTTKTVPDTLYMGIRLLPVTSGRLTVRFMGQGGTGTGWQHDVSAGNGWQLHQAQDTPELPWDYTGDGRLLVSYTGECYIRFVALMNDPVSSSRTEYSTLFEQTSRRIVMQAARQSSDLNEWVARFTLEAENIRQLVTTNKEAADKAVADRQKELEDYMAMNDPRVDASASWITTNSKWVDIISQNWDASGRLLDSSSITVFGNGIVSEVEGYTDGKLTRYSTTEQTADGIAAAVKDLAKGADVLALDRKIDSDMAAISGSLSELEQALGAESDENDARQAVLATWQQQTSARIDAIAGRWDADGNLIGYSTTEQTADGIAAAVKDLAKGADVLALDRKINSDMAAISGSLSELEQALRTESDENDTRQAVLATWQQQTSQSIDAIAGRWDAGGNLIGYSTTEQTAELISSTVTRLVSTNLFSGISDGEGWDYDEFDAVQCRFVSLGSCLVESPYVRLPAGTYTFSALYLNADSDSNDVSIDVEDDSTFFVDGDVWYSDRDNRQSFTFSLSEETEVFFRFDASGIYYIVEPKLEAGSSATPFLGESEEVIANRFRQTVNETEMIIYSRLGQAGIHIDGETRSVELYGDKVTFCDKNGGNTDKIWIDPDTGTLNAVDGVFKGSLLFHKVVKRNTGGNQNEVLYDCARYYVDGHTVERPPFTLKGDIFILSGTAVVNSWTGPSTTGWFGYRIYLPPASMFKGASVKIVNGTYSAYSSSHNFNKELSAINLIVWHSEDTEKMAEDSELVAMNGLAVSMPFKYYHGGNSPYTMSVFGYFTELTSNAYGTVELVSTVNPYLPQSEYWVWLVIDAQE